MVLIFTKAPYIGLLDRVISYIYFIKDRKHNQFFKEYFTPNKIIINALSISLKGNKFIEDEYLNLKTLRKNIERNNSFEYFELSILNYLASHILLKIERLNFGDSNLNFNELKSISLLVIYKQVIIQKINELTSENEVNTGIDLKEMEQYIEYIEKVKITNFKENFKYIYTKGLGSSNNFSFELILDSFDIKNDFFILEELPSKCFQLNYQDTIKDLSYRDLSDGEQSILQTRVNLERKIKDSNSTNCIFLFDEPNNNLHPQWEKLFIEYIIEVLKEYPKINFHIVISSHSPFIISDLPKENVIFLKDGVQVKGIDREQTFGANIHTLLSDGFFMEDGLMGEFAKGKINEIIYFHNLVKKDTHHKCLKKIYQKSKQKKFWQIQSIIGEEYLKQVIKNHLIEIESILLGKKEAKKEEIKRVETYLESLKND